MRNTKSAEQRVREHEHMENVQSDLSLDNKINALFDNSNVQDDNTILNLIDLSRAHLISSLVYTTVPLSAYCIFSEYITLTQVFGIALITIGSIIVAAFE